MKFIKVLLTISLSPVSAVTLKSMGKDLSDRLTDVLEAKVLECLPMVEDGDTANKNTSVHED